MIPNTINIIIYCITDLPSWSNSLSDARRNLMSLLKSYFDDGSSVRFLIIVIKRIAQIKLESRKTTFIRKSLLFIFIVLRHNYFQC
jgi:hypothetical protein